MRVVSASGAAIVREHFSARYGLELHDGTPAEVLRVVTNSQPVEDDFSFEVRGRQSDGASTTVMVTRSEIRRALRGSPT